MVIMVDDKKYKSKQWSNEGVREIATVEIESSAAFVKPIDDILCPE